MTASQASATPTGSRRLITRTEKPTRMIRSARKTACIPQCAESGMVGLSLQGVRLHRVGHHLVLPPARLITLHELLVAAAGDGGEIVPGRVIPRHHPRADASQQLLVQAEGDGWSILWLDVRPTQGREERQVGRAV